MENIAEINNGLENIGPQSRKSRLKFIILLAAFFAMFFLRDILGIAIHPLYFLIASTILFVFFDESESIAFIFCLALLNTAIQYNYAIGAGVIILFLKQINKVRVTLYIIPFIILFAWELLHIFIPPFSTFSYIRSMIPYCVWIILIAINGIKFRTDLIIKTFVVTLLFTLVCILLITLESFDYSLSAMWERGFRLGFETSEIHYILKGNPNDLGFYCNLGISSLLLLSSKEKSPRKKIVYYITIFVLTLFGFSTMSRAFIVISVFIIFYFFWFSSKKSIGNKIKNILLAISVMVFLIMIVSVILPDLFKSVLSRFLVEDISSGRNTIFADYTALIFSKFERFFFGFGMQGLFEKTIQVSPNITNVSHNGIQEIFVVWGFVGFVIVCFIFFAYFSSAKHKGAKITFVNMLPFLVAFIKIQSGQFVTAPIMTIMFMYAYICLFERKQRSKE